MKEDKFVTGRRDALKTIGLGSAALLTGGLGNDTSGQATQKETLMKTSRRIGSHQDKKRKSHWCKICAGRTEDQIW